MLQQTYDIDGILNEPHPQTEALRGMFHNWFRIWAKTFVLMFGLIDNQDGFQIGGRVRMEFLINALGNAIFQEVIKPSMLW